MITLICTVYLLGGMLISGGVIWMNLLVAGALNRDLYLNGELMPPFWMIQQADAAAFLYLDWAFIAAGVVLLIAATCMAIRQVRAKQPAKSRGGDNA